MAIDNVTDKIRKVLLNYDLEIEMAKAQLRKAYAKVSCFKDSKSHYEQQIYYTGQLDKIKYQTYIEQLKKNKKKVLQDISNIIDMYYPEYKYVWIKYCIECKQAKVIAKELKIHHKTVHKIIRKINRDLINYGIVEGEQQQDES